MNIFLSGATGFIGARIAHRLAEEGHTVHALYRSESKLAPIRHPNIRLFKGDLLDGPSILKAMETCSQAYHVAAFAGVWSRDPEKIFRLGMWHLQGAYHFHRRDTGTFPGRSRG